LTVVPTLPDRQREALDAAYKGAVAAKRQRLFLLLAAAAALVAVAGWTAEVRPLTFAENLWRFTSYFQRILPVLTFGNFFGDVAEWYWNIGPWLLLLGETLLIAYLGTLFGAFFAFFLCFLAAANLGSPVVRFAARRLLELLRTVPEVVFALLFVIAFGLGPMPGVFALALHSTGALGKLFSEVVENADMKPFEGIAASGGTWLERIRFAILPQVLPSFASYALLRFEINVRSASVMGFVGAGGIGQELITTIRQYYYSDVSAVLLLIILTVMVIDIVTERLRHRLIGLERA
jgi:phosphonate transport system permease protein